MDCFKTIDDEHDFFVKLADFWTTDLGLELIEVMRFKRDEYKNIVDATAQKLLTEDDFDTFNPKIMNINEEIRLALKYHRSGDLQQAENIYREILKIQPDNVDALHFLGILQYQLGNHDSAIECIENVLRRNPNDPDAYYNLGDVFLRQGDVKNAIKNHKSAIDINPGYKGRKRVYF